MTSQGPIARCRVVNLWTGRNDVSSLFLVALPTLLLFAVMGVLSPNGSSRIVAQELKRKTLHISVGLTALSFPLFLSAPWMIITAVGLVVTWFIGVRRIPAFRRHFGAVLHDINRESPAKSISQFR